MLGPGREITADDVGRALPEALRVGAPSAPLVPLLEHERRHIEAVLGETNFNMRRAASILGIARSTLYARVQKYGIAVRDEREPKRGAQ
jgi:DNA-binding NtrC family response regulator